MRTHHRGGQLRLRLLLLLAAAAAAAAEDAYPYGARGDFVTAAAWSVIQAASIANIGALLTAPGDLGGVTVDVFTPDGGPYTPNAYTPLSAAAVAHLPRLVAAPMDAVRACVAYAPCAAVHVFAPADATVASLFSIAVYYGDLASMGPVQDVYGPRLPMDPDVEYGAWRASALPDRSAGLECADTRLDPVFFWHTYAGAVSGVAWDVLDACPTLPVGPAATDADIIACAGALQVRRRRHARAGDAAAHPLDCAGVL